MAHIAMAQCLSVASGVCSGPVAAFVSAMSAGIAQYVSMHHAGMSPGYKFSTQTHIF